MTVNIPRGTKDILPQDINYWQEIENTARSLFKLYNYQEIRTPIFEETLLFSRSIGEGSAIVEKEMYTFLDKKNRSLTLRPEGTAPVIRAYLTKENKLRNSDITRLFYFGQMFRYERPQAGRFRQFHQIGVEAIGESTPLVDAEVIVLAFNFFKSFDLAELKILLNSLGCLKCQKPFKDGLKEFAQKHYSKLCPDCNLRINKNIMRIFDCKNKACQDILNSAPKMFDLLCEDCQNHFSQVKSFLQNVGVNFILEKSLVRGLDYYIRTAFEIVTPLEGRQNAVCGGGRYLFNDKQLFDEAVAGVGFAFGAERLVDLLKKKPRRSLSEKESYFIAAIGNNASSLALNLAEKMRQKNKIAEINSMEKSLKAQMRYAHRQKFSHVLIIGDEEIKKGRAVLKKMVDGSEREVRLEKIEEWIAEKF